MALAEAGFLDIDGHRIEYRFVGPQPDKAPTLVLLHEGLGCVGLWNDFPEKLAAATGVGVSALKMRVKRACDALRLLLTEDSGARRD